MRYNGHQHEGNNESYYLVSREHHTVARLSVLAGTVTKTRSIGSSAVTSPSCGLISQVRHSRRSLRRSFGFLKKICASLQMATSSVCKLKTISSRLATLSTTN